MSARAKKPTGRPPPIPARAKPQLADETPTAILDPGQVRRAAVTPIKAISLKTPGGPAPEPAQRQGTPDMPKVKLRAISEVTSARHATPQNLGYLAPPRDPAEVRARRVRDYVIWGCVSVILASAIALAVWFIGR